MQKAEAKTRIAKLVEKFNENFKEYKSNHYNETATRRDFIDPFFAALGWDVENENKMPESTRDVRVKTQKK